MPPPPKPRGGPTALAGRGEGRVVGCQDMRIWLSTFRHHTCSAAPGSRANSEQFYGSFGGRPIIFGSRECGSSRCQAQPASLECMSSNPGAPASQSAIGEYLSRTLKIPANGATLTLAHSLWMADFRVLAPKIWKCLSLLPRELPFSRVTPRRPKNKRTAYARPISLP
jgi:hypothetical protein